MIDNFKQIRNIDYLKNEFGNELWVQVCGHKDMNGADGFFWAGLMSYEDIEEALRKQEWEHSHGSQLPGFVQYGSDEVIYERYSMSEYEPLLFVRDYHGVKEEVVELSEEFRHLNNLYHDVRTNKFYEVEESGDLIEVAKIEGTSAYIKLKYLVKYSAAKQMAIALYFDIRYNSKSTLEDLGVEKTYSVEKTNMYTFDIQYSNMMSGFGDIKSYSMIMGKKFIFGGDISNSGYWPFEKKKECETFIIGIDKNGDEIEYSSEHHQLNNNFNGNPDSPHYLTPVHFTKDVLTKYFSNPDKYEVNDGLIRCKGLWLFQIDNHHDDYVTAYLGDIGRDLPRKEQLYWKSFNVVPDGGISEEKFKRDFMAEFTNPTIADLKFKQRFIKFKRDWSNKFGWEFFLQFTKADQYNFEHLRLPVANSQVEFDGQVLSLVKTIIDSINEKKIGKLIQNKDELRGGISKLERYLSEQGIAEYEKHIKFLRNLQDLRSTGSGHRKGKSYEKASAEFTLDEKGFVETFKDILNEAYNLIEFLDEKFLKDE